MGKSPKLGAQLAATTSRRPRLAYIVEPRFPGGTSAAVARELETVARHFDVRVYGISSAMFAGREITPTLAQTLNASGIELIWDPVQIQADIVILHNPSFLKFDRQWSCRILAHRLLVVCHENLLRPSGAPSFDVEHCLGLIDRASLATEKIIAPISPYNRSTIDNWASHLATPSHWRTLGSDWFNICDFDMQAPNPAPQDRRGRLSRPGFEKFPPLADLHHCFSAKAQSNIILGADGLMDQAMLNPHWTLIPFRGMDVAQFFEEIDFMVYFTSPSWRESFGRVLAEAIAAGKVVLTDRHTAENFGDGVVAARPDQVDGMIADFVADPARYAAQVRRAQAALSAFGTMQFLEFFDADVVCAEPVAA